MATTRQIETGGTARLIVIESAPFAENTWCLHGGQTGRCVLFDPGFEPDAIIRALDHAGLTPALVLLTHGHSDHIAGNAAIRARWPEVPLAIGAGDAPKLTDARANLSAAFGFEVLSPPADRLLADGERLSAAGFTFACRTLAGHSAGHVVYLLEDHAPPLVFGGDVLFEGSVGRTDFPDGDAATLFRGIRERLYTLPDETLVLPGHGNPTTIGRERMHNPFVQPEPRSSR
jgi:glyoxylase-like metal-dependent hydrolase (beta-lactamase superfamily II)